MRGTRSNGAPGGINVIVCGWATVSVSSPGRYWTRQMRTMQHYSQAKPLSVKRAILGVLKRRPAAGRIVVLDPGSGRTEEPVSGCEPVALAIGVAPTCPPGSAMSSVRIVDELTVNGVRDLTLECT